MVPRCDECNAPIDISESSLTFPEGFTKTLCEKCAEGKVKSGEWRREPYRKSWGENSWRYVSLVKNP